MLNFVLSFNKDGKRCAIVERIPENNNLAPYACMPNLETMTYFPTKKKAEEVAAAWNDGYRENNEFCPCVNI